MSTLEQQMAARRARILEAARELIEALGYEGLTMRDLAEAGGVTVPTIYNLIGTKEQVLLAAVEEQTRPFVTNLHRSRGDLPEIVEAAVRQLVRRPTYYRSLLLALASSEQAGPALRHVSGAVAEQIERALADLEAAGELAAWIDPAVLAERLHVHIDSASTQWASGGLTSAAFRATALFDVATTMLGVTAGASHEQFERIARESQKAASRGRAPRSRRGRAA